MTEITKIDMVVMLNQIAEQFVAAMVKHGDGEERDPIIDMLSRNIQIINAITERVKEMTAVEYLEAKHEMCVRYVEHVCKGCPLNGADNTYYTCTWFAYNHPRRAVEIVKRWKEEHND